MAHLEASVRTIQKSKLHVVTKGIVCYFINGKQGRAKDTSILFFVFTEISKSLMRHMLSERSVC